MPKKITAMPKKSIILGKPVKGAAAIIIKPMSMRKTMTALIHRGEKKKKRIFFIGVVKKNSIILIRNRMLAMEVIT